MSNEVIVFNTLNEETRMLSARELHEKLGVGTRFDTWFGRLVEDCQFSVENGDFIAIAQKRATAQGNMTTYMDYDITLDVAKEACMLCRNDYGKSIRRYFIDIEKEWRKQQLSSPIQRILNNSKDQYEASLAITEMLKIEHEKQLVLTQQKEQAEQERDIAQKEVQDKTALVNTTLANKNDYYWRKWCEDICHVTTNLANFILKKNKVYNGNSLISKQYADCFKMFLDHSGYPTKVITPKGQQVILSLFQPYMRLELLNNGKYTYNKRILTNLGLI